eukprot:GSA25T00001681001.1
MDTGVGVWKMSDDAQFSQGDLDRILPSGKANFFQDGEADLEALHKVPRLLLHAEAHFSFPWAHTLPGEQEQKERKGASPRGLSRGQSRVDMRHSRSSIGRSQSGMITSSRGQNADTTGRKETNFCLMLFAHTVGTEDVSEGDWSSTQSLDKWLLDGNEMDFRPQEDLNCAISFWKGYMHEPEARQAQTEKATVDLDYFLGLSKQATDLTEDEEVALGAAKTFQESISAVSSDGKLLVWSLMRAIFVLAVISDRAIRLYVKKALKESAAALQKEAPELLKQFEGYQNSHGSPGGVGYLVEQLRIDMRNDPELQGKTRHVHGVHSKREETAWVYVKGHEVTESGFEFALGKLEQISKKSNSALPALKCEESLCKKVRETIAKQGVEGRFANDPNQPHSGDLADYLIHYEDGD